MKLLIAAIAITTFLVAVGTARVIGWALSARTSSNTSTEGQQA